jgi:hypothetical protein
MKPTPPRYWFHAKSYGWGWGFPASWQGWLFMAVWLLAVFANSLLLTISIPLYILLLIALCAALIAVCYAKGPPPRWRWGN